jgi:predicted TIM-barrel fold metal-dependent hydrolase
MIIDAHVHVSTYTGKGNDLREATNTLLKEMDLYEIDYSIVIPDNIENDPNTANLNYILNLIRNEKRLFALGSPQIIQRGSSEIKNYRKLLEKGTIKGLKFFPGHDPYNAADKRCMLYYELLQEFNYPIVIHTGDISSNPKITNPLDYNDPKYIVEIARKFPKLKVIITHYFWPKIEYCYEITKNSPNIYFELAGTADPEVLEKSGGIEKMRSILEKTIQDRPDKVIFGTDWPMCDVKNQIELVESLKIDKEIIEKIFSKNAIEVYKLQFD